MPFYENPQLAMDIVKIFVLAVSSTLIAVFVTPLLTHFLYKYKLWRKEARTKTITGDEAPVFYGLHKERETKVPRFGGLLIWGVTLLVIFLFFFLSRIFSDNFVFQKLNFFSRSQTWLPLFTLAAASLVGFADDILQVFKKGKYIAGGMRFSKRLLIVFLIGVIGAWWFYAKLEVDSIHIPLVGDLEIGFWYVPLFILVMLACWSGGIVDGLDGLAGGVFASIFTGFGIIAFFQGQIDLAAFCAVIAGTILAFLWFNIPPARFYMGETGSLGLVCTLGVVAFLTDSVVVLPIIAGILVVESGSVILQLLSKRFRKKKIFLCTPLHHHFEAKGWPPYKVTMRFWVVGVVLAIVGVVIKMMG
jgi:phospho-N-acetylmuramoyl-pentapeptide-transferase